MAVVIVSFAEIGCDTIVNVGVVALVTANATIVAPTALSSATETVALPSFVAIVGPVQAVIAASEVKISKAKISSS